MLRRTREVLVAAATWLGGFIEELVVVVALVLLARGFWLMPSWQAGAFLAPAAVLLWLCLPSRSAFIDRRSADAPSNRRGD